MPLARWPGSSRMPSPREVRFYRQLSWQWNFLGLTVAQICTALGAGLLALVFSLGSLVFATAATLAVLLLIFLAQFGETSGAYELLLGAHLTPSVLDPETLASDRRFPVSREEAAREQ